MKRLQNKVYFYLLIFIVSSCTGSASYREKINSNYELLAIDNMHSLTVVAYVEEYRIGVINETVFAVGYDDDFIIAKQHPLISFEKLDKSITNYFIIPLKNKISDDPEKNVIGPLTEEEFNKKRIELFISNELNFTMVFVDLE